MHGTADLLGRARPMPYRCADAPTPAILDGTDSMAETTVSMSALVCQPSGPPSCQLGDAVHVMQPQWQHPRSLPSSTKALT